MMQHWAGYLDGLKAGANVIALYKGKWHKPLDMNLIELYCIYMDILNGDVR